MARNRRLQSIPQPTHVESEVRKILVPMIDAIERRLIRRTDQNERAVTRQELIDLGLVTEAQINQLPEDT